MRRSNSSRCGERRSSLQKLSVPGCFSGWKPSTSLSVNSDQTQTTCWPTKTLGGFAVAAMKTAGSACPGAGAGTGLGRSGSPPGVAAPGTPFFTRSEATPDLTMRPPSTIAAGPTVSTPSLSGCTV